MADTGATHTGRELLMGTKVGRRILGRCEDSGNCLLWSGHLSASGYGRITVDGVSAAVHRAAWEAANGTGIAEGLVVDHLCGRRACVNPSHLEVVTQRENTRRACAVLSAEDVREIFSMREGGATYKSIAETFGVSDGTVSWHLGRKYDEGGGPLCDLDEEFRRAALGRIFNRCRRLNDEDSDSCLLWSGHLNASGYGKVTVKYRSYLAHRAVCELESGIAIPEGMHIGHRCANRRCVEPSHLEVVSAEENNAERAARGAVRLATA